MDMFYVAEHTLGGAYQVNSNDLCVQTSHFSGIIIIVVYNHMAAGLLFKYKRSSEGQPFTSHQ